MLKRGRECIKGHRAELVIIQLFLAVCWLIPIAAELILRRFLPSEMLWQNVLLVGSFVLNRLLLAPAHTGYYACCRRLAVVTNPIAVTSEIEDLREELTAPTLLACFFLDYRHPIKSLKWQLRYDAFRFVLFSVLLFPALLFLAVGALEESSLLQAVCVGGSVLFAVFGMFCGWLTMLRFRPMLYRRPQYGSFWGQVYKALQISRGRTVPLLSMAVKYVSFAPVSLLPFVTLRAAVLVEQAVLFATPQRKAKKRRERIFHTRVLRDA